MSILEDEGWTYNSQMIPAGPPLAMLTVCQVVRNKYLRLNELSKTTRQSNTHNTTTLSNPGVTRGHCNSANAQETEVPLKLLLVAGSIDDIPNSLVVDRGLLGVEVLLRYISRHVANPRMFNMSGCRRKWKTRPNPPQQSTRSSKILRDLKDTQIIETIDVLEYKHRNLEFPDLNWVCYCYGEERLKQGEFNQ